MRHSIKLFILFLAFGYSSSVEAVIPSKYSIEILWINSSKDEAQPFVHRARTLPDLKAEFLDPIFGWAEQNPNAVVHVWFDSEMTTDTALHATQELVEGWQRANSAAAPIVFKNIRELAVVRAHPEAFAQGVATYFRVDLAKVLTSLDSIEKDISYSVFADLDLTPIGPEELFDPETLEKLSVFGIVVNEDQHKYKFENQFHILSQSHSHVREAIQYVLIQANIEKLQLIEQGKLVRRAISTYPVRMDEAAKYAQMVYNSYSQMFQYLYSICGLGKGIVTSCVGSDEDGNPIEEKVTYVKETHGLAPFSEDTWDGKFSCTPREECRSLLTGNFRVGFAPTKKMSCPLPGLTYTL